MILVKQIQCGKPLLMMIKITSYQKVYDGIICYSERMSNDNKVILLENINNFAWKCVILIWKNFILTNQGMNGHCLYL